MLRNPRPVERSPAAGGASCQDQSLRLTHRCAQVTALAFAEEMEVLVALVAQSRLQCCPLLFARL